MKYYRVSIYKYLVDDCVIEAESEEEALKIGWAIQSSEADHWANLDFEPSTWEGYDDVVVSSEVEGPDSYVLATYFSADDFDEEEIRLGIEAKETTERDYEANFQARLRKYLEEHNIPFPDDLK